VSAEALAVWCDVLRDVPESRLILHALDGSHRQRTWGTLASAGIDPTRLSFVGKLPLADYYRQYHNIDIALDPFPYGGGTTSGDALWMGVPVVTLCGLTAVGRGGVSLLSNLGLEKLVARSVAEYAQIAIALAGNLGELEELRRTLRPRMEASVLMDTRRFARHVEGAYRQMWQWRCEEKE